MMEIAVYLLKSSVCIAIFFLFYRIFLVNDTNFKFVRWYLLISVVLSLTLPLSRYSLILFLFLGRLLMQFVQLLRVILRSEKYRKGSYILVYSNKIPNSLSFF